MDPSGVLGKSKEQEVGMSTGQTRCKDWRLTVTGNCSAA
jgi:hypothetical protein